MKKQNKKKLQYQLWDMQYEFGCDYKDEMQCLENALEQSGYSKPHYYLILKNNRLIKSFSIDRGKITWTNHASSK